MCRFNMKFNIFDSRLFCLLFMLPLLAIFFRCANVVAPQGGPVDEDPPEVIRSTPPNYSTHYDGSDVRIFFNEYVRLHNLHQKMLVSPPLKTMPEVRIRGRSIIMSIDEELEENTTYNFFFGDAIQDITEHNPIPNFQFVVSTGDYVDSLSVRGEVINAFDLKPAEGVYVMMYDNIYDSVPYKELPVYISRTDKEGRFEINNMRKGEYLMFALKDLNYNFIFDQPDEKIAFLDSLVAPEYVATVEESENGEEESENGEEEPGEEEKLPEPGPPEDEEYHMDIEKDSILPKEDDSPDVYKKAEAEFYRFYLFKEEDTVQRISSARYTAPGKLTIEFRIPFDSVYVEEYKDPFDRDWKISEFSENKDSLFIWLDNVDRDSLYLKVWDGDNLIDTVKRSLVTRDDRRARGVEPQLTLTTNHGAGRPFHYPDRFEVTANNPIKTFDTTRVKIFVNDSIPVESIWKSFGKANRRFKLDKELEQETEYKFIIPDSTFTDIFGLANADTLRASFKTSDYESYGIIMLNINLPVEEDNYILQLFDGQDRIVKEKFINQSAQYLFSHLSPGEYRFKVIHDKNNSGKWNTGNYLRGIQPEPVYIFDEKVAVRQNWEHEVIWDITRQP